MIQFPGETGNVLVKVGLRDGFGGQRQRPGLMLATAVVLVVVVVVDDVVVPSRGNRLSGPVDVGAGMFPAVEASVERDGCQWRQAMEVTGNPRQPHFRQGCGRRVRCQRWEVGQRRRGGLAGLVTSVVNQSLEGVVNVERGREVLMVLNAKRKAERSV